MRFCVVFTVATVVFCSQFVPADARSFSKPDRPSSLRPYTEGALLYRTQQLDPALMRRSPPEEVLDKYVKQNQQREALLNQLRAGGDIDIFQITSGTRSRSRYYDHPRR